MPDFDFSGNVKLEIAVNGEKPASVPINYEGTKLMRFSSFKDYQEEYGNLFFKLTLGYEFTNMNETFSKGFSRVGLLLYGIHYQNPKNLSDSGDGGGTFGVHQAFTAALTSSGEQAKQEVSGSPELAEAKALEAENVFFIPFVATQKATQLFGAVAVQGVRKTDSEKKADIRYYGGLRLARNPQMYADFLYGKTESRGSKRVEVRGQFPLYKEKIFLGAIGNFGVKDRDKDGAEDVVRVYLTWNIEPKDFIDKFVSFLDVTK
jgi:hypothetical protein